jgi:hypothetical protein
MLLWPNILVILFICTCGMIGMAAGHGSPVALYIVSVCTLAISCMLIVSEYRDFPEPYDKNLRKTFNSRK